MDSIVRIAIAAVVIGVVVITFGAVIGNVALMSWTFLAVIVCIAATFIYLLFS